MRRVRFVVGSVFAVCLMSGAIALDRARSETPPVGVVLADDDGLPDVLVEGVHYVAMFEIEWSGPPSIRDGEVRVFVPRRGSATEDVPADRWPLVCETEFDDVVSRQRLTCPFEAPGPGEFALLLEVIDDEGVTIGQTLYVHLVVEATEPD